MPITLKQAFADHGIAVQYRGHPATLLPVTDALAVELDPAGVPQPVQAGQMIAAWNDGARRHGAVLNGDARNDIGIAVTRRDGTEAVIGQGAGSIFDLAVAVLRAKRGSQEETARIDAENAEAARVHEAAVARGETVAPPEPRESTFTADAFDRAVTIVPFAQQIARIIKADAFADIAVKAHADTAMGRISELTRETLLPEDKARVDEAWRIRAEISILSPGHADAAPAVLPAAYEGDGEAARELMSGLPRDPEGVSAAQRSAMAVGGNRDFSTRVFSVATTTPAHRLVASPLSHAGMRTLDQELARYENTESGPAIIARMQAVTRDAMPTYDWQGKLYTRDGADVLLMRDQYAAFVYAWDADSRIADVDVEQTVLRRPNANDIPTDAELERLRGVLQGLRHDNGAEIDFGWDDLDEDMPRA